MSKAIGTCALCHRKVYINHLNLCKRCNKLEESLSIKNKEHEKEMLEKQFEEEQERKKAEQITQEETPKPEEETPKPAEQKEEPKEEPAKES